MQHRITQWFTETTYVDVDTGEQITRERFKKEGYRIINKIKKTRIHESTGIIGITNECRATQQLKLF